MQMLLNQMGILQYAAYLSYFLGAFANPLGGTCR